VTTYANVVSIVCARIAPTLAALNDLKVKMGDIENAYLMAPITDKVWTVLGPEFGADAGKWALVVRALYSLKYTGDACRTKMADLIDHLTWKTCLGNHELWMKEEMCPHDVMQ
jgi:hypothetical protein